MARQSRPAQRPERDRSYNSVRDILHNQLQIIELYLQGHHEEWHGGIVNDDSETVSLYDPQQGGK
ncbi:hypothetical protein GZ77_04185 [Endozoicomonas montiporae]|uniref:Uncharacterized protein n=2 Tax=Endozoicomonas montiporae TaxID=1027273 RepID=A0A081NBD3_9GAMM|nr:hypothetical protein EZMO1_1892 [Endozoicomonas montiporae CL-33]KEQ15756.1 hypothetical protein GZ77_04185 [Endozoicomonas montiporae]